jgi:uncharacterized iron-regulated membrane protein
MVPDPRRDAGITVSGLPNARTPVRRLLMNWHRWLGLGSGVVLALLGLTGVAFYLPVPAGGRHIIEELHVNLMIPTGGREIVVGLSVIAILLELTGLYLWWWRRRIWRVRWRSGWRLAANDLHNVVGAALFVVMLLLAGTAVGRVAVRQVFPEGSVVVKGTNALHTGLRFPAPVKLVYALGGLGFLAQGLTGVMMWWPVRGRTSANASRPAGG